MKQKDEIEALRAAYRIERAERRIDEIHFKAKIKRERRKAEQFEGLVWIVFACLIYAVLSSGLQYFNII